jgi:hypothetical protein
MHFLFLLLRLVLDCLIPAWRDGLTMAARTDGQIEHLPIRPALWDCWLSFLGRMALRGDGERRKVRARWGAARLRSETRSE